MQNSIYIIIIIVFLLIDIFHQQQNYEADRMADAHGNGDRWYLLIMTIIVAAMMIMITNDREGHVVGRMMLLVLNKYGHFNNSKQCYAT